MTSPPTPEAERDQPALIGVQRCGCITYVNARPDKLDRYDEKVIQGIVHEGGQILRTTVAKARNRKHFLPAECPHEPKGWVVES